MRIAPLVAAALLLAAGAGTWLWINDTSANQQEPGRPGAAGAKGGGSGKGRRFAGGDGPVPVTVMPVAVADMPITREGIGNVQSLATVTVRSQVDGRLLAVEFSEGQDVRKGQVLARVDPVTYQAQLDQAIARKAQNEAMLANARLDLERAQKLMSVNAGSRKTEDTARAQVRQIEAQVKADDAAIDNARAVLGYTTIVSPLDGRAGLRLVDAGNLLRGDSSAIVSIMQVSPIAVVFTLPQRDLATVSAAMGRAKVPVEILAADGKAAVARGELATVDNQIDQATGTIKLKAHFANDDRRLWPGQFVSVRVVVDTIAGARVVPTAAIRRGPPGTFVYAVGADRVARIAPVKLALETETQTVVAEGLEPGTEVVTAGFARLSDGKAVDVIPAVAPGKGDERRRSRDGATDGRSSGAASSATPEGARRPRREGGGSMGDRSGAPDAGGQPTAEGRDQRRGEGRRRERGEAGGRQNAAGGGAGSSTAVSGPAATTPARGAPQ